MQKLGSPGEIFYIQGILKTDYFITPSGTIGNAEMDPARPIDCDKTLHQFNRMYDAQKFGTAVVADRRLLHVAVGPGILAQIEFGVVVAAIGDSTITFDLYKNGVTCLTGAVTLDSGDAAFTLTPGTIAAGGAYIVGDVFELVITISAGTGTLPQAPIVSAVFQEASGV